MVGDGFVYSCGSNWPFHQRLTSRGKRLGPISWTLRWTSPTGYHSQMLRIGKTESSGISDVLTSRGSEGPLPGFCETHLEGILISGCHDHTSGNFISSQIHIMVASLRVPTI